MSNPNDMNKEGNKNDLGKARFDLVTPESLKKLVDIYTYVATKYDDRNWEKGIKWSRVFAAIMRHLWDWWAGEEDDFESGLSHLAHAAWGCFSLMEYERRRRNFDDREDIKMGRQLDEFKESK